LVGRSAASLRAAQRLELKGTVLLAQENWSAQVPFKRLGG